MQFLFIAGCDRSGTTAFVNALNYHSEICIGMERFKNLVSQAKEKIQPYIFEREFFFNIKESQTNVLWDGFYRNLENKFDQALIVGDKVPRYFEILSILRENFPSAIVIFLLRDPVSVCNSWKKRAEDPNDKNWPLQNGSKKAVNIWNLAMKKAYQDQEKNPEKLIFVSYESFFSGNIDYMLCLLKKLSIYPDDSFLEGYLDSTKNWEERSNQKLVLNHDELEYIKNNANYQLYEHLLAN